MFIALRRTRANLTAQRVNFKESLKNFAASFFIFLRVAVEARSTRRQVIAIRRSSGRRRIRVER